MHDDPVNENRANENPANDDPVSGSTSTMMRLFERYTLGAPPESDQFDFFIGTWDCEMKAWITGADPVSLAARWDASWLQQRRMLMDELVVRLDNGDDIAAWVSLRTWCADTDSWQITSHQALAPCRPASTSGRWNDGEMTLTFSIEGDGGEPLDHEVMFHDIGPDSFEWQWNQRVRCGTWRPFAQLSATRIKHPVG